MIEQLQACDWMTAIQSFRERQTIETLASRAEIGVWVQAPGRPHARPLAMLG